MRGHYTYGLVSPVSMRLATRQTAVGDEETSSLPYS